MILSNEGIRRAVAARRIVIVPFDERRLNPNSYNIRLGEWLWVYDRVTLDMAKENPGHYIQIPPTGYVLQPGRLYLAVTEEYTETWDYVPTIEGRSSVGRLGLSIHSTAAFGDRGYCGRFTLELSTVEPIRIYPFIEIGQMVFTTVDLDGRFYEGKYNNRDNDKPIPSRIWKELGHLANGGSQPA